jgi:Spy/CpxP family protein refolding chaperone
MSRTASRFVVLSLSLTMFALLVSAASAQESGRRGRGFGRLFVIPKVALARVDEVRAELKLNDEQSKKIDALNDELSEGNRTVFEDAQGDWTKVREGMTKIASEINAKLDEVLDDAQQTRVQEIYVQVNGTGALQDEAVAAALKLTDEQKKQLQDARDASRQAFMDAGLRDLDEEARTKKIEELTKDRDDKTLAVLTDDQRATLDKMKGAELKIDPANLPSFGRGGGQRRPDTT